MLTNGDGRGTERERLQQKLNEGNIPEHMHEGLLAYILDGRPVGDFLTAVLSNNLREACNRADDKNKDRLWDFVYFLYNYAPSICWGNEKNVTSWLKQHAARRAGAAV